MADRRLLGGAAILALLAGSGVLLAPTGSRIDAARARAENVAWRQVIDRVSDAAADNDPIAEARRFSNPVLLGTPAAATVWPLRQGGASVATVIRVPVPEGYNGSLDVVVGIDTDGAITGVAVPTHRETPEYGGRLVHAPDFLRRFVGLTESTPAAAWDVAPGDGSVDGVTGATITMTAVTNGVLRALRQHAVMSAGAGNAEGAQ